MIFSNTIIDWYNKNARDLPWRKTNNPYEIWISEIILQQTKVDQGIPYYIRFIKRFPTIESLADANEKDILKIWQGLGYYNRARNLHFTAKYIVNNYNSVFPSDYNDILKLKGIGHYTAAAIASFCYNLPYAVLDGNVSRVLTRYLAIELSIDSTEGRKYLIMMSQQLLNHNLPALHNQAIMEFGALQCIPKSPDCNNCPIRKSCKSFGTDLVALLPIKSKSFKIQKRYFNYLIITNHDSTFIQKRTSGIWKSLFEFPLVEGELNIEELQKSIFWRNLFKKEDFIITHVSRQIQHFLSHQKIFATFIHVLASEINSENLIKLKWSQLDEYPIPRLIDKYLSSMIKK